MGLGTRGPFRKLKAIGKGSFGTVFLVQRDGASDKKYVMKEIALRGLPPREIAAAQNEVSALKKLAEHPHIIAYEESLVVDGTLCIVMVHRHRLHRTAPFASALSRARLRLPFWSQEWASGGDLGALIAKRKKANKPFSEPEVLKILYQLTSALAHCHHELRMLHRDLKPQNVFLTAEGDVKLGDFGLAKVATRSTY